MFLRRALSATTKRMASTSIVELDGRTLEGGGQLLRNAVAFSALTRTPVHIPNVRQNRDQPGLKAQHAAGLQLVTRICSASAQGIDKGSQTVSFDPTTGFIRAGEYEADPGTAGSTTLLFQVSLPCLLFPQPTEDNVQDVSTLTLRGGTNALHAPQADFAQRVLLPFLTSHILPPSSSSSPLRLDIKRRGFFPHGGGILHALIPALHRGQSLRSLSLTDRGHVLHVHGSVIVSGVIGTRIASELRDAAHVELRALSPELAALPTSHIHITIEADPKGRAGSAIILVAYTSTGCILAGSALGSSRARAEVTGRDAAGELVRHLKEGGCVDSWMQDQMIIFLALASGRSVVRTGNITLHTRTAIWVAERLTGAKFEVKEDVDGTSQSLITCEGIGLEGRL